MMKDWIELLRLWIWELLNWDWIDEICEFDWVDELCELHVFDGNELVVLNGWLICGKPRKKNDEIESICYMMRWEIGQCEIAPNEWYEKKKNWLILKKMPRKGKWMIWKKDAQMGKEYDEIDENGLPNINLPI